jgi:hypothetical protein
MVGMEIYPVSKLPKVQSEIFDSANFQIFIPMKRPHKSRVHCVLRFVELKERRESNDISVGIPVYFFMPVPDKGFVVAREEYLLKGSLSLFPPNTLGLDTILLCFGFVTI